ncbi:MAG: hypothetical protein LUD01_11085, partial [Clostridiales bacterium]|nr:hypothetical protein [Clostridiales bacterium]
MKKNFRLIYPPDYDTSAEQRMKDYSFVHSLQIDDMVVIKQESYRGFSDLHLENYFSMDPAVLDYRLSVVEDLVENPPLYQAFVDSVTTISNINTLGKAMDSDFSVDSALSSVRYLEMYRDIVELFSGALSAANLRSEGMQCFREQVQEIVKGEEYQSLSRELAGTEMDFGYLKSVTIGVNLDENLQPKEAGILSVNQEEFRPGTVMNRLLKKKSSDGKVLLSTLYPLARGLHGEELKALNHGISNSLRTIFTKSLRDFEPLIQNYYKVSTAPFVSLLDDIRFLTAGTEFILKMRELGFPMCRPQIASMEEKRCDLKQVYNPILALREVEKTVVSNSFTLDEKGRFYLVTGPNHGGKSIFAYSVGMAQALFQLGLFVPAEFAYMSPVSGI